MTFVCDLCLFSYCVLCLHKSDDVRVRYPFCVRCLRLCMCLCLGSYSEAPRRSPPRLRRHAASSSRISNAGGVEGSVALRTGRAPWEGKGRRRVQTLGKRTHTSSPSRGRISVGSRGPAARAGCAGFRSAAFGGGRQGNCRSHRGTARERAHVAQRRAANAFERQKTSWRTEGGLS